MKEMGRSLHESLCVYFSKLRRSLLTEPSRDSISRNVATAGWLLSACRHPKTASFAHGRAAAPSDVDGFLFENFNSLYRTRDRGGGGDGADDDWDACAAAAALDDYLAGGCSSPPRPREADTSPSEPRAPRRFFVPSGASTSDSLLEDARPSAVSCASSSAPAATVARRPPDAAVPGDGVAVQAFSMDPYEDFRRSMQEMVDARRGDAGEPLDWDFMRELLVCYLELNDRGVHSHILRAFTDLAVAAAAQRRRDPPPEAERVGISEAAWLYYRHA